MVKENRNCRTDEDNLAVAGWVTATRAIASNAEVARHRSAPDS
jgi:hypothetical protein